MKFRLFGLISLWPAIVLMDSACARPPQGDYRPFSPAMKAGDLYTLSAESLRPTQPSLGYREVAHKKAKFDRAASAEVIETLKKKNTPVVIGPGGLPFLTDGHHTCRALLESTQPDKTVYGVILANWSELPLEEFWAKMTSSNYAHLIDNEGKPTAYGTLPQSLRQLPNDPYRGLAWAVLEKGGFEEKTGFYFQEFFWGEFFRARLKWDDSNQAEFEQALAQALELARTPEASKLPGYRAAQEAAK